MSTTPTTTENTSTEPTTDAPMKIYLAGSIDDSDDYGNEWRDNIIHGATQYVDNNVEFLNPLDKHNPLEKDVNLIEVVPDDVSLLEQCDGILLKYEHEKELYGTPCEQGYALAKNIPVAVWWKRKDDEATLDETSVWMWHPETSVGVYKDRDDAMSSLLWEVRNRRRKAQQTQHTSVTTEIDDTTAVMVDDILRSVLCSFLNHGGTGTMLNQEQIVDEVLFEESKVVETLDWLSDSSIVRNTLASRYTLRDTDETEMMIRTLF